MEEAERDFYEILGVPETATDEEIKRAYRAAALRTHPDTRSEGVATTVFHELQAAYAVLSDPARRNAYDRRRNEERQRNPQPLAWEIMMSRSRMCVHHSSQLLYALAEVHSRAEAQAARLPLNLCLVVDRSTSMHGARLEQVKEAAHRIIAEMNDEDALAVVAFGDRAEVVWPLQSGFNRAVARSKVAAIQTSGGTEILQGLQAGLAELERRGRRAAISHLVLLTDGQTYGDEAECVAAAQRAGAQGIAITAVGIGADWNDNLLDEIAAHSGGVSAYAARPGQVVALLQQRMQALSMVVAQKMTLTPRCVPGVQVEAAYRVSPTLGRLAVGQGPITLGPLQADVPLVVVLELGIGPQPVGLRQLVRLELHATLVAGETTRAVLRRNVSATFTLEEPPTEPVPTAIVRALGKITLYRMQEQAWAALEAGDVKAATQRLRAVATRLLDLGEEALAQAALLEAGRIEQDGSSSAVGRKEIKYGTRHLELRPEESGHG